MDTPTHMHTYITCRNTHAQKNMRRTHTYKRTCVHTHTHTHTHTEIDMGRQQGISESILANIKNANTVYTSYIKWLEWTKSNTKLLCRGNTTNTCVQLR